QSDNLYVVKDMYKVVASQEPTSYPEDMSKNEINEEQKNAYVQSLILKLILDYNGAGGNVDPMKADGDRIVYTYEGDDDKNDDDSKEDDNDDDVHLNNIQPNDTTPSTTALNIKFISKMFYNFVNYITSFGQNVPGTPEQVVQTWFNYFHERINENPNFWKEEKIILND
ncbi:unnamed protein product, partial [Rotaria sordida]